MAAKIEAALGFDVKLIAGSGGVFEIQVDDALVFSKAATGNFPDEDVLIQEMLKAYQ